MDLTQAIEKAQVILQVLDVRDPLACRCPGLEQHIRTLKEPSKRVVVLLLNKTDLVPREATKAWLAHLRQELPTVAFTSAMSPSLSSSSGGGSSSSDRPGPPAAGVATATAAAGTEGQHLVRRDVCPGAAPAWTLLQALTNYARAAGTQEKGITVAVVGLPGVGKRSVINSLKLAAAPVQTGASASDRLVAQEEEEQAVLVCLDPPVRLLHSPGVVADAAAASAHRDHRHVDDPVAHVAKLLERVPSSARQLLVALYRMRAFADTNTLLESIAAARGKDSLDARVYRPMVARGVLKDWHGGRIPHFTLPPPTHTAGGVHTLEEGAMTAQAAEVAGHAIAAGAFLSTEHDAAVTAHLPRLDGSGRRFIQVHSATATTTPPRPKRAERPDDGGASPLSRAVKRRRVVTGLGAGKEVCSGSGSGGGDDGDGGSDDRKVPQGNALPPPPLPPSLLLSMPDAVLCVVLSWSPDSAACNALLSTCRQTCSLRTDPAAAALLILRRTSGYSSQRLCQRLPPLITACARHCDGGQAAVAAQLVRLPHLGPEHGGPHPAFASPGLAFACQHGYEAMVVDLLASGPPPAERMLARLLKLALNPKGQLQLCHGAPHLGVLRLLLELENGGLAACRVKMRGKSVFHFAAMTSHRLPALRLLVQHCPPAHLPTATVDGLRSAVWWHQAPTAAFLLAEGSKPDAVAMQDLALRAASWAADEVLRDLLPSCSPPQLGPCLLAAAGLNQKDLLSFDCAEALLDAGVDVNHVDAGDGPPLLTLLAARSIKAYADDSEYLDLLDLLLQRGATVTPAVVAAATQLVQRGVDGARPVLARLSLALQQGAEGGTL